MSKESSEVERLRKRVAALEARGRRYADEREAHHQSVAHEAWLKSLRARVTGMDRRSLEDFAVYWAGAKKEGEAWSKLRHYRWRVDALTRKLRRVRRAAAAFRSAQRFNEFSLQRENLYLRGLLAEKHMEPDA